MSVARVCYYDDVMKTKPETRQYSNGNSELVWKTVQQKLEESLAAVKPEDTELRGLLEKYATEFKDKFEGKRRPVRVFIDGCFDLMHAGHFNAVRQAKALGDILVVGVHTDEEIKRCKGPPVMNDNERLEVIKSCKWVDEICFGVPYSPSIELLNALDCDFVVHGDDIAADANGVDVYESIKRAGRMQIVKRTAGVSTTALVQRLLKLASTSNQSEVTSTSCENVSGAVSSFLSTTWRLTQFSNHAVPNMKDKIVYICGDFDLFHVGHIELLRRASLLGTFLYVGIYEDKDVDGAHEGRPVMNINERVLTVLSCRYVNEVVIGAPRILSADLIINLNLSVVAVAEGVSLNGYEIPLEKEIVKIVPSDNLLATQTVIDRIVQNRILYEKRNSSRLKKEEEYIHNKHYVAEI